MKMYYGNTPVKSLNIKHFEMDTNSATVQPSDLQAGVTCFGKGKKITGTGKCFEFAFYANSYSNTMIPLPNAINVIQIASVEYPVQQLMTFADIRNADFNTVKVIGNIVKDDTFYPVSIQIENNILKLTCEASIKIQLFYGKDNYV